MRSFAPRRASACCGTCADATAQCRYHNSQHAAAARRRPSVATVTKWCGCGCEGLFQVDLLNGHASGDLRLQADSYDLVGLAVLCRTSGCCQSCCALDVEDAAARGAAAACGAHVHVRGVAGERLACCFAARGCFSPWGRGGRGLPVSCGVRVSDRPFAGSIGRGSLAGGRSVCEQRRSPSESPSAFFARWWEALSPWVSAHPTGGIGLLAAHATASTTIWGHGRSSHQASAALRPRDGHARPVLGWRMRFANEDRFVSSERATAGLHRHSL